MVDPRNEMALRIRYMHSLLCRAVSDRVGFMLTNRSQFIKFDETAPLIDLSQVTDQQSGLSIGDYVYIHNALLAPWDPEVDERDSLSGGETYIVAFVTLEGKCGRARVKGTFAVLSTRVDVHSTNHSAFVMTGKDNKFIALYFVEALQNNRDIRCP